MNRSSISDPSFLALAAADLALWQLDFRAEVAILDQRWAEWLAISPSEFSARQGKFSFAEWRSRLHPHDLPRVRAALIAFVKGETDLYSERYRIRSNEGKWVWLEDRGRIVERDEQSGRALKGIGVCRNVTVEMEQAAWKEWLSQAVLHSPVATLICDASQQVLWANPAAESLFGSRSQVVGHAVHELLGKEAGGEEQNESEGNGGRAPVLVTLPLGDRLSYVERIVTRFESPTSGEIFSVYVLHDVTQRIELEQQLRHLALTDVLTGLPNRRAFMERAASEFARYQRGGGCERLAVALVDLDHFKRINDSFGHSAGDAVLRDFARVLHDNFRSMDGLGRLGGEEFGILVPLVPPNDQPLIPFERLLTAVRSRQVNFAGDAISYTCSIGVTEVGSSDRSLDDVLARADRALYRAKEEGRNRVVWLPPGE